MTTTAKLWTVNGIKDAMRAAGSHWFDPDTMRFFGTKVLPTVYQGPGGVFFVTSEQPPHGGRKFSVRQFDPAENDIDTVGDFAEMSRDQAIRQAKKAAVGKVIGFTRMVDEEDGGVPYKMRGVKEKAEEFKPVSVLEQFIDDCAKHGHSRDDDACRRLMNWATHHHNLMEQLCSDETFCRQVDAEGNHPDILNCRAEIRKLAKLVCAADVLFSGDPRGCTVKLTFADGFTNDYGNEGVVVPTSEAE